MNDLPLKTDACLKNRFWWFCVSRLLSVLADQFIIFAVPIYIYLQTENIAWSGAALAAQWLPRMLLLPILGPLVEGFPVKGQLFCVDGLRLCLLCLVAVSDHLVVLLACLGSVSLLSGYAFVVLETAVARNFSESGVADTQCHLRNIDQYARMIGPAAAGLVFMSYSAVAVGIFAAALVALSLTFLIAHFDVPRDRRTALNGSPNTMADLRYGARLVLKTAGLRYLFVIAIAINLSVGVAVGLAPAVLLDGFGIGIAAAGYVLAAAAFANIATLAFFPRLLENFPMDRLGVYSVCAFSAAGIVLVSATSFEIFVSAFIILHAAAAAFACYIRKARTKFASGSEFGQVVGFFVALVVLSYPLAGAVISILSSVLEPRAILATAIVLSGLASLRYASRLTRSNP